MTSNPIAQSATHLEVVTWSAGEALDGEQYPLRMAHAGTVSEASTFLPLGDGCASRVRVGTATLIDVRGDNHQPLIVNWLDTTPDRIFEHIPRTACPVHGVVTQVCDLIRGLADSALREFMGEVFSLPDVFRYYWTCPASLRDHHRGPAGLALHSLEVAVLVSTIRGLTPGQRDLAICHALLHDVGKLWSYNGGELTPAATRMGHGRLDYEALAGPLQYLACAEPNTAIMMETLLAGAWRHQHKHPAAVIGSVVNAMDRLSASKGNFLPPSG